MQANYLRGDGPSDLYRRAASGSLDAQRDLADAALAEHAAAVAQGGLVEMAALESLFWSRLAASHGHDTDVMRLCEALSLTANAFGNAQCADLAEELTVETLAILETLASAGNAEAVSALHAITGDLAPELIQRGRNLAQTAEARHASA